MGFEAKSCLKFDTIDITDNTHSPQRLPMPLGEKVERDAFE